MRVQIYTNDREQPIDLEVLEMRTQAREIITNENGHHRGPSIDQMIREVIRDPAIGASANLLFTTPEGREGAIYLKHRESRRGDHLLGQRTYHRGAYQGRGAYPGEA